MLFAEPAEIIVARQPRRILRGLAQMEAGQSAGQMAGRLHGLRGRPSLRGKARAASRKTTGDTPLLCFGVFDAPQPDGHPLAQPKQRLENEEFLTAPNAGWNFPVYKERFDRLHQHLRQGDCYQANLTMPVDARWNGDPRAAFWSLIERQPVKYGALVDLGGPVILSRSPELFFRTDEDGWIETHPMKGTAKRGATPAEDAAIVAAMRADMKTQAENRMIVDLLRNDISRITEVGTLDVPKLFDIETYPTVHQMVSHVQAKLLPDLSDPRHLRSALSLRLDHRRAEDAGDGNPARSRGRPARCLLRRDRHDLARPAPCAFPSPSAPSALFEGGKAIFNVGGGIVFDSTAEAEYEECLLKARFADRRPMDRPMSDFSLIETMRWEPGDRLRPPAAASRPADPLRPSPRLSGSRRRALRRARGGRRGRDRRRCASA